MYEKIVNTETGEEIIREYTKEELAEVEKAKAETAERIAKIKAKEDARISALAKLAALGLTKDEIAAL